MSRQNEQQNFYLRPLRFVIHHSSQKRLSSFIYDVVRRSRLLRDNLETSLKRVGKHAVANDFGPQLPAWEARRALENHGMCRDTARSHIDLLVDAGELSVRGTDVVLRVFQGDIGGEGVRALPRDPAFWTGRREAKLARRRAKDAARRAKPADQIGRARAKKPTKTALSAIRRCPVNKGAASPAPSAPALGAVDALPLPCGRLRPQNTTPRPATAAPILPPAPQPPPMPAANAPLVVACAPKAKATEPLACPPSAASAPPPSAAPSPDPLPQAPATTACTATESVEDIRAILVRQFGAVAAPAPAPAVTGGAALADEVPAKARGGKLVAERTYARPLTPMEREIEQLAVQRGMEAGSVNLRAVTRTGAPLPIIIEALGVTADAGPRARNPPAFFLGTIRKLMLQSRRA